MSSKSALLLFGLAVVFMTTGCSAVALTGLGVGASAGASHGMGGYTYKTFTIPIAKVRSATMAALKRMAINVESSEKAKYDDDYETRTAN